MNPRGRVSAFDIREILDEAVRTLTVSSRPLQERVRASRMVIVDRLRPTDFASSEDRELFNQIQAALTDTSSPGDAAGPGAVTDDMPDVTAEAIASDILDLRDTTMGRAIRNARITTRPQAHGRSRR